MSASVNDRIINMTINPIPKSNNYYSFSSCSPPANASESRYVRREIRSRCRVRCGASLHCLFFFLFRGSRLARPAVNATDARGSLEQGLHEGVGVGFGVVPAWLTFKTKPSGCSQAPCTECRRISRYSLRPKIWPTVYYPRSLICFATDGVSHSFRFVRKYTRTPRNNILRWLTPAYLKLSSFPDKWRLRTFQKSYVFIILSSALKDHALSHTIELEYL